MGINFAGVSNMGDILMCVVVSRECVVGRAEALFNWYWSSLIFCWDDYEIGCFYTDEDQIVKSYN